MKLVHFILTLLYNLSAFGPRDENMIVFGSWFGTQVSDNPKYLLDKLVKKDSNKAKLIWIGNKSTKCSVTENWGSNVKFYKRNSLMSLWIQLRAKYVFVNQGYLDLGNFNLTKKAIVVQLWHGFPVKKIVADVDGYVGQRTYYHFNYFLSTSKLMTKRLSTAFKFAGINSNNVIKARQPRNDVFINEKEKDLIRIDIRNFLNIQDDEKMVTYLPTFRDSGSKAFSFNDLKPEQLQELIKNKVRLVEKAHFADGTMEINSNDNVTTLDKSFPYNTQELLAATDVLVTDYSSVYVDFLLLNRPIIHFVYDLDEYINDDRGLYNNDFTVESAGSIIKNNEDLITEINSADTEYNQEKRNTVNDKMNEYRQNDFVDEMFAFLPELRKIFKE